MRVFYQPITCMYIAILQLLFSRTLYRTYFIEYEFPVAADYGCGQAEKNDIGLEITRIATKKTNAQSKPVALLKYARSLTAYTV